MSMTFTVRSPEDLRAKLDRFVQVFPGGVKEALWDEAHVIMNQSVGQVPVDTGYLRSTSYVNDPFEEGGKIAIEMGYYANYAAPVHDIDIGHYVGKSHFLSDPFEMLAPSVMENIVLRVEQKLGGE